MKYTIFDTPDDVTKRISALKKAGITAIMRYDDPSGNAHSWKQIGVPEYNSILAAGIAVAIISEWANDHVGYFNAAAGKRDAAYSLHRAQQRNQPQGSAFYSAVDFDAAPADMRRITAFFKAFAQEIRASGYKVGCYGSGYTNGKLKAAGLIDYEMITCSPGFLGSKDAIRTGNYDVWQVFGFCDQNYMGLSVDWDTPNPLRKGDWGQILPSKKAGKSGR
jgi:hypothetical protein